MDSQGILPWTVPQIFSNPLEPLITMIKDKKKYLIIITSDHAGHDKIHGSDHPEDSRLPLIMISDIYDLTAYQDRSYKVSQLKSLLDNLVME